MNIPTHILAGYASQVPILFGLLLLVVFTANIYIYIIYLYKKLYKDVRFYRGKHYKVLKNRYLGKYFIKERFAFLFWVSWKYRYMVGIRSLPKVMKKNSEFEIEKAYKEYIDSILDSKPVVIGK